MSEVELVAFLAEQTDHIFRCPVVFLEGTLTLVEVFLALTFFCLVQIPPLVFHHRGCVRVDDELDLIDSIDVVKTHIIVVVIVTQDDAATAREIASGSVVPHWQWLYHHW